MRTAARLVLPVIIPILTSCSSGSDNNDGGALGSDGGASSSGTSGGSSSGSSGFASGSSNGSSASAGVASGSGSGSSASAGVASGSSSGSSASAGVASGSGSGSSASAGFPSGSGSGSSASAGFSSGSGSGSSASSGSTSGSDGGSSTGSSGSSSGSSGTCTVGSLPSGGTKCTCSGGSCSNCNTYNGGVADGLDYGIWESGTGGSITYFTSAHAFSASWGPSSADFLAHVGLDYNVTRSYTTYGKIVAQFAESKSGSAGNYSSVGMYGWLQNPCVEWYIVEDSFHPLQKSGTTAVIDGATYYLIKQDTHGTAGANACTGSVSSWTQLLSVRSTPRQCGTITVSDHFAAWAQQKWSVGDVSSIHINVEVGGGTGSIEFPTASVSTNN